MLKIAFCDDETAEIAQLEELLEEYAAARGQEFVHTSYQSSVELMADIEKGERFDIMLLDILMPGENGMTAAREVREHDTNVKIIFLTASPEFAVESYAVDAWYSHPAGGLFPPDGLSLRRLRQRADPQPHPPQ